MSDGVEGGGGGSIPEPTTFREAEVIGLRFMQEGRHEDALTAFKMAMKLPGSRYATATASWLESMRMNHVCNIHITSYNLLIIGWYTLHTVGGQPQERVRLWL
jgi:hypothetical protein